MTKLTQKTQRKYPRIVASVDQATHDSLESIARKRGFRNAAQLLAAKARAIVRDHSSKGCAK